MMLATALFNMGTGSNGAPEQKRSESKRGRAFVHVCLHRPFCLSMAARRWRLSSQTLCSTEPLARPKERKVAMAKRRCLLQTWPLLKKSPPGTRRNRQTGSGGMRRPKEAFQVAHPSFPSKSWSPSGCTAGPRSCRPASRWPPSQSSTPTQTPFCVFPGGCRRRSRKHQPAVGARAGNKGTLVKACDSESTLGISHCCSSNVLVLSSIIHTF